MRRGSRDGFRRWCGRVRLRRNNSNAGSRDPQGLLSLLKHAAMHNDIFTATYSLGSVPPEPHSPMQWGQSLPKSTLAPFIDVSVNKKNQTQTSKYALRGTSNFSNVYTLIHFFRKYSNHPSSPVPAGYQFSLLYHLENASIRISSIF